MFLQEAVESAKEMGLKWIAVDSISDGLSIIFAFESEPIRNSRFWMPSIAGGRQEYIGVYEGSLEWVDTKRKA